MNDKKNIIEVYKKRKYNEFLINKREKEEEIRKKDEFVKITDNFKNKVKEYAEKNNLADVECILNSIFIPNILTKESQEALKKAEVEFKDNMDERNRIVEEVEAQLMIVETYEQEIEILKKYGILDENGKIYDYRA